MTFAIDLCQIQMLPRLILFWWRILLIFLGVTQIKNQICLNLRSFCRGSVDFILTLFTIFTMKKYFISKSKKQKFSTFKLLDFFCKFKRENDYFKQIYKITSQSYSMNQLISSFVSTNNTNNQSQSEINLQSHLPQINMRLEEFPVNPKTLQLKTRSLVYQLYKDVYKTSTVPFISNHYQQGKKLLQECNEQITQISTAIDQLPADVLKSTSEDALIFMEDLMQMVVAEHIKFQQIKEIQNLELLKPWKLSIQLLRKAIHCTKKQSFFSESMFTSAIRKQSSMLNLSTDTITAQNCRDTILYLITQIQEDINLVLLLQSPNQQKDLILEQCRALLANVLKTLDKSMKDEKYIKILPDIKKMVLAEKKRFTRIQPIEVQNLKVWKSSLELLQEIINHIKAPKKKDPQVKKASLMI